jgi:hypothetical protein
MTTIVCLAAAGGSVRDFDFLRGLTGPPPSDGRGAVWGVLIAAGLALAFAWLVVALVRRDRARHGPTVRHLARGLGLAPSTRRFLARVAAVAGQPGPGGLLISRGCFDAAAEAYVARWGEAERLRAVRVEVFGEAERGRRGNAGAGGRGQGRRA